MNRFASGDWLTRERITSIAWISAVISFAMLLFLWGARHGSIDFFGQPVGSDFTAFWDAGRLANEGRAVDAWNPAALNAHVVATHGVPYTTAWMYPPVFLLAIAPLSAMPYLAGLLIWQLASLAAIGGALGMLLRDRRALLVALASPLTVMVLANGQNALLTGALLCAGLAMLERRPVLAGALLAGLAYKPQLALLIIPLLLFTRNWRAMAAATVTGIVLIGASILLWGVQSWLAFFGSASLAQTLIETGGYGIHKSASLFSMMRQWGASLAFSYGVQALGALAAIGTIWRLRAASLALRAAGVCAGVALSTPYLLDYDMAAVGIGAVFLYVAARDTGFLPYERSALAFIWVAPWFGRPAAELFTLPLGPMATIVLVSLVLRRAARAPMTHGIAMPPFTCSVCPVTYPASIDAR